jgi:DNA-binding HxlR family transcriptional regulator
MRNTNARLVGARRVDTRYIQDASRSVSVLFQGKWRVEILCAMRSGPVRVGQLSRLIPGASKKMLAHNLRQLEADGIVLRRDMSEMVLHVEYDLTNEAREEVCSLLDHLAQWGRLYALSRAIPSTSEKPPII